MLFNLSFFKQLWRKFSRTAIPKLDFSLSTVGYSERQPICCKSYWTHCRIRTTVRYMYIKIENVPFDYWYEKLFLYLVECWDIFNVVTYVLHICKVHSYPKLRTQTYGERFIQHVAMKFGIEVYYNGRKNAVA